MASKKTAARKSTKSKVTSTDNFPTSKGGAQIESPNANTGASHTYRVDMGESLPAQSENFNPNRAK